MFTGVLKLYHTSGLDEVFSSHYAALYIVTTLLVAKIAWTYFFEIENN